MTVEEIVRKINGRGRMLHQIWNILSKKPESKKELEELLGKMLKERKHE